MEARRATFAGMWPHEGKKGWKCKTKQVSLWFVSPFQLPAADTGSLSTLDGNTPPLPNQTTWPRAPTASWPSMGGSLVTSHSKSPSRIRCYRADRTQSDEHYNRSPECAFFVLVKQFEGTRRKTSRGKASRGSKASRLSVQSVASEALSVGDTTAVGDDSVVTTTSTMSQGGKKAKGKRGAAGGGSRSKPKRNEPVEPEVDNKHEEQPAAPTKPAKSTRGKKRGSEAVEDIVTSLSEAPATKKRATRTRSSTVTDASTVIADDSDIADASGPARKASGRRKNAGSSAKTSRQVSALSTATTASVASLRAPADEFPDDEEIERQLEADLARESDEDDQVEAHRAGPGIEWRQEDSARQGSGDYAMFDPAEAHGDDAAVEAELLALQAEMQVDEQQQPQVLKKGRKAAARTVSAQTKPKSAKAASPLPEEAEAAMPEPRREEVVEERHDVTAGSTDTLMRNAEPEPPTTTERGRDRPSEASLAARQSTDAEEPPPQPVAKRGRGRPSKASLASRASAGSVKLVEAAVQAAASEQPKKGGRGRQSKSSLASRVSAGSVQLVEPAEQPVKGKRGRPSKASLASRISANSMELAEAANQPATETRGRPSKTSLASLASVTETETEGPPRRSRGRPAKSKGKLAEAQPLQPAIAVDEAQADDLAHVTVSVQAMQLDGGRNSSSVAKERDVPTPGDTAAQDLTEPRSLPAKVDSPAASARQAALSPSPSPQSSDAENHAPSSKQPASTSTKRVALAPVTTTPLRGSPSKRNVLAGLESSMPWTAVNLEAVLGTPGAGADKENTVGRMLRKGKELTSPEKGMTVEEWIYFNAGEAEEKLKHECETMVSRFEREGTRAMNVLEGLSVEQTNC